MCVNDGYDIDREPGGHDAQHGVGGGTNYVIWSFNNNQIEVDELRFDEFARPVFSASKSSVYWDLLQTLGVQSESFLYDSLRAVHSAAGTERSHSFPNPDTVGEGDKVVRALCSCCLVAAPIVPLTLYDGPTILFSLFRRIRPMAVVTSSTLKLL